MNAGRGDELTVAEPTGPCAAASVSPRALPGPADPLLDLRLASLREEQPRESSPVTGPIPLRRRRIGDSSLLVFPVAINGTGFGRTIDAVSAGGILDAYRGFGGNFIDTSSAAAGGRSESIIGDWMRSRRARSDVVIATRVGSGTGSPGVSQAAISTAVDRCLERLGTDHVDLLYLDTDDPSVSFEETLLAVDALIGAGKVRFFGLAAHAENRLVEARVITAQLGVPPVVALQVHYSLLRRDLFEGTLAGVVAEQGLGVTARFPLGAGFLGGKYRSAVDLAACPRGRSAVTPPTRRRLRVLAVLSQIARERHVAPATVALAWLLAKPRVVAPVPGVSGPEQVLDLVAAPSVQLTRHEVAALDRVSS